MNSSEQTIQSLLLATLQSATSQDPFLVNQAEQNLAAWEKEENFYQTLLSFYKNSSLDESARFVAIITLKNGVDKHWRKNQKESV